MIAYRVGVFVSGSPGVQWTTVSVPVGASDKERYAAFTAAATRLHGTLICFDRTT